MIPVIIVMALVCALIVICVLRFPEVRIGKLKFAPYWVIALIGAVVMLLIGGIDLGELFNRFTEDTAVNPLKILGVFFGMTILSVFLDEAGFFAFLASYSLSKAKGSQKKLFTLFYFTVAVLTVFTSNDIIILTFTPFIIYFCSRAEIDPKPYLFGEFAAANTFSMMLIIGNPTNIYLAAGNDFFRYLLIMVFPAILTGVACFFIIWLLFKKQLALKLKSESSVVPIKDKPLAFVALSFLAATTILLAVSGYIGLEIWYIAVGGAGAVLVFSLVYGIIKKRPSIILGGLKRVPWALAPFLLSMFTLVCALTNVGVTDKLASFLNVGDFSILTYLLASVLSANLLNNIPMSVLFGSFVKGNEAALFATIVGSNLGALLTPVGALAGIMWMKMLKKGNVKLGFKDFCLVGAVIVAAALPVAAAGLYFSLYVVL